MVGGLLLLVLVMLLLLLVLLLLLLVMLLLLLLLEESLLARLIVHLIHLVEGLRVGVASERVELNGGVDGVDGNFGGVSLSEGIGVGSSRDGSVVVGEIVERSGGLSSLLLHLQSLQFQLLRLLEPIQLRRRLERDTTFLDIVQLLLRQYRN